MTEMWEEPTQFDTSGVDELYAADYPDDLLAEWSEPAESVVAAESTWAPPVEATVCCCTDVGWEQDFATALTVAEPGTPVAVMPGDYDPQWTTFDQVAAAPDVLTVQVPPVDASYTVSPTPSLDAAIQAATTQQAGPTNFGLGPTTLGGTSISDYIQVTDSAGNPVDASTLLGPMTIGGTLIGDAGGQVVTPSAALFAPTGSIVGGTLIGDAAGQVVSPSAALFAPTGSIIGGPSSFLGISGVEGGDPVPSLLRLMGMPAIQGNSWAMTMLSNVLASQHYMTAVKVAPDDVRVELTTDRYR